MLSLLASLSLALPDDPQHRPCQDDPILVAGRVLGPDGKPREGVSVTLETFWDDDWVPIRRDEAGRHPLATTQADGTFEVRGRWNLDRFRVVAQTDDRAWIGRMGSWRRRVVDVTIHLSVASTVEGVIVHPAAKRQRMLTGGFGGPDPGFYLSEVIARLHLDDGESIDTDVKYDGTFAFEPMPVGTGNLELLIRPARRVHSWAREPEPILIHRIPDISFARQGQAQDARLNPIDLDGHLLAVTVHIEDCRGLPLVAASVSDSTGELWYAPFIKNSIRDGIIDTVPRGTVSDHSTVLLRGTQPLDLKIFAPGCLPAHVRGLRTNETIVLEDGHGVRVELSGDLALPDRCWVWVTVYQLAVNSEPVEQPLRFVAPRDVRLTPGTTETFWSSREGEIVVGVYLARNPGPDQPHPRRPDFTSFDLPATDRRFTLPNDEVLVLPITQPMVEKALRHLDESSG